MPSIIDIYNKNSSKDTLLEKNLSKEYSLDVLREINKKQEKFITSVDFSKPENFAKFGFAEEYYKTAIKYISDEYPYDESIEEKYNWINSLTDFEHYLFFKEYPRSTGHVFLSENEKINVYSHVNNPPQASSEEIFNYKSYSENTLLILNTEHTTKENYGICFESWLKFSGTPNNILLQINVVSASNSELEEVTALKIKASSSVLQIIDKNNNTASFYNEFDFSSWHHYAFNIRNTEAQIFIDGQLQKTLDLSNLDFVSSSFVFTNKGLFTQNAYKTETISQIDNKPVFTLFSGSSISADDSRLWNNIRTIEQIGENWFTNVNGNTNKNILDSSLLFYFKFNEGWDLNFGNLCIDYSGRKNHSNIINYTNNSRRQTSAIDESNIVQDKEKPEIIVSGLQFSSAVKDFYYEKIALAKEHDENNIHLLYNKFPSWIIQEEEEGEQKHLKQIIQILSYYFDDLYNKIKEITEFKKIKYNTDLEKIYPFYDKILTSMGFDVTDIFNNISSLENIISRNQTTIFDEEIKKVKNIIFQNIYNNLLYIYKTKGTEKSLRSFIRSYGISEDLVRINLYADKYIYGATDRSRETAVKKKTITLTDNNSVYLSGDPVQENNYFTMEIASSFPFKFSKNDQETSLFGVFNDLSSYNVSISRDNNIYSFNLNKSSSMGQELVSSSIVCDNFYDDSVWNLCLRKKPNVDKFYDNVELTGHTIELYGINTNTVPAQQFSCSMPYITGSLPEIKYYIGAEKQNLTGEVLKLAGAKYLYCNLWSDMSGSGLLSNNEIISHNKDILNYGVNE